MRRRALAGAALSQIMMNTLDRMSIGVEAAIRILVVVIFAFMLGAVLLDVAARNSASACVASMNWPATRRSGSSFSSPESAHVMAN
jgi:hypothetical protein